MLRPCIPTPTLLGSNSFYHWGYLHLCASILLYLPTYLHGLGWNPGLCACLAPCSVTELYPQPSSSLKETPLQHLSHRIGRKTMPGMTPAWS